MKRNKVLLGLYVGLLTLAGGTAGAQTGNFYEIGPANVGGQVSSLVLDTRDSSHSTVFAGATTGGLFVKSANEDILRNLYSHLSGIPANVAEAMVANHGMWHRIPYRLEDGTEAVLPIGAMTQTPDGTLFIGTGGDEYAYGTNYKPMSRKGMGIFMYNPETNEFSLLPNSGNIEVVNSLDYYVSHDGILYLFAATNTGLFRWRHVEGQNDWVATPVTVFQGNVDQVIVNRRTRVAYFTASSDNSLQLLRLGNVMAAVNNANPTNPLGYVDISSSNNAFSAPNKRIHLAVTSSNDSTFLYAMVIDRNGIMENLYLTMNEQTWFATATSSVKPILYYTTRTDTVTYDKGYLCGAVLVDPKDPRRVIIGGTDVYVGKGYVDGSYFQWTSVSASEKELNYGDYMSTVFSNSSFVHSGIQQIIVAYTPEGELYDNTYYFATDGGVYNTDNNFISFNNDNLGLNNLQINGIAVSPDGTIISGANNNACPLIETHLDHAGGNATLSWFDYGEMGNLNHNANIIWTGNGGAVAASMFQQVNPDSRRTLFTSAEGGNIGRTYADYLDYTNPTTWTTDVSFKTDIFGSGPAIGSLYLWETDNNTIFKDSVRASIDTLGYIFRKFNGSADYDTVWLSLPGLDSAVYFVYRDSVTDEDRIITLKDTITVDKSGSAFKILAGDKINVASRGHADYPFEYVFKAADVRGGFTAIDTITVQNRLCSHMLAVGDEKGKPNGAVFFAWTPTDFTKVFDTLTQADPELNAKGMYWSKIFEVRRSDTASGLLSAYPRQAVFSRDGRFAFVNIYDAAAKRSKLVRISGFDNIVYENGSDLFMNLAVDSPQELPTATFTFKGSEWFSRPISNIAVDNRDGQDRLILTFEEFSTDVANVAIVNNASTSLNNISEIALPDKSLPAYCALVEDLTGNIYVGTENGLYIRENNSWKIDSNLTGIPVTAMCQQTANLPVRHNLTHTGINANNYAFARTKWRHALYFGTYGRGIFMDKTYVTDTLNEVVDSVDYTPVAIPTVRNIGQNSVKLFPNPVYNEANVAVNSVVAGNGLLRIYDINGHLVSERNLGRVSEGENLFTVDCQGMSKGMYLVNVIISGHTATAKMIVR